MNILCFQFASNYSNIYLPGYLYLVRNHSITHGNSLNVTLINNNIFLYFKLFYKYIKHFSKSINILFYEMELIKNYLNSFEGFNNTKFLYDSYSFLEMILNDKNLSLYSKILIKNFNLSFKF